MAITLFKVIQGHQFWGRFTLTPSLKVIPVLRSKYICGLCECCHLVSISLHYVLWCVVQRTLCKFRYIIYIEPLSSTANKMLSYRRETALQDAL